MASSNNSSSCSTEPTGEMLFGPIHVFNLIFYTIAFIVSCVGNITMFLILIRNMKQKISRVYTLLVHMNVADLLVTFIVLPKDIVHYATVRWVGPDWGCKVGKFFDVFGVYLSANVLICMSLDRFCSIMFPLYTLNARERVRFMLICAWVVSAASSLPQLALFKTYSHPCFPWFRQCMSKSWFAKDYIYYDLYNSILNALEVYLVPFVIICLCYSAIMYKISKKDRQSSEIDNEIESQHLNDSVTSSSKNLRRKSVEGTKSCQVTLRRSDTAHLKRARSKTLRMTVVMVLAFIICWTPYFIAATLHFADIDFSTGRPREELEIPVFVEQILYLFAVLNSCINPYLYGYFSFDLHYEILHLIALVNPGMRDRLRREQQQRRSAVSTANSHTQHRPIRRNFSDSTPLAGTHRASYATEKEVTRKASFLSNASSNSNEENGITQWRSRSPTSISANSINLRVTPQNWLTVPTSDIL